MKKGIVALILVAAVPFFVHAYTSPGKPGGYVNDFANVLDLADISELESTLSNFEKETGVEIVIVTVPSLGDEDPVTYGVKLFEEWGIGKADKDNGLLILHAPNERQIRIEVGYGLEGVITDVKASSVYRNILAPAFKAGEFGRGYREAVAAITATIRGEVDAIPEKSSSSGIGDWFVFILFIPLWLASILGRSKSWWFGGVLGGIAGVIIGLVYSFWPLPILIIAGLIFDYIVSKAYHSRVDHGLTPPWWIGGGGHGGGFGGFGGGSSGGGGGGGGY